MSINNIFFLIFSAAVSFMVAEMFDKSVNLQEITRAARLVKFFYFGKKLFISHKMALKRLTNADLSMH